LKNGVIMNRERLIGDWVKSSNSGSLLIAKHDPNEGYIWENYHSVLSIEMSSSLHSFIVSKEYTIKHYDDSDYPYGEGYFEIIPHSNEITVTGLGFPPSSPYARDQHDRLVIVSGSYEGWHIFSQDQNHISASIASGRLTENSKYFEE
jgi:hypothetical protein